MKLLTAIMLASATTVSVVAQDTCESGTAEALLVGNDVRAAIYNNGALFYSRDAGDQNTYEVPAGSGLHSMFSAGLWMGGRVEDSVRVLVTNYGPFHLRPGPLGGSVESCSENDRIYSISRSDLDKWNRTGIATDDMMAWPWELGAPVTDGDGNLDNYDLAAGDHPELLADQRLWWIMNDGGVPYTRPDSEPLHIEVRTTAFAGTVRGALEHSTFYQYEVTYRGDEPLKDAYIGMYFDADLGSAFDDYVGSDTTLGMGYAYNFDDFDEGGYGEAPPAVGVVMLNGSSKTKSSFPTNGEAANPLAWNYLTAFLNNDLIQGYEASPQTAAHYYNMMQGLWWWGYPITEGFMGSGFSQDTTKVMFPGEPGEFWSELNWDGLGGRSRKEDRVFMVSNGPFTLNPGESTTFYFAIVWSRGKDNLDSVRRLKKDAAIVKQAAPTLLKPIYEYHPDIPPEPDYPLGANGIYPNPASDTATLDYSLPQPMNVRLEVFDVLGRRVHDGYDGMRDAGEYKAAFDVSDWPAGVYTARLQLDQISTTKTFAVAR